MAVSLPPIDSESWQDHNREAAERADAQARADLEAAQRLQEEQEARRQADRNLLAAQQWEAATAPHREAERSRTRGDLARDLFAQATAPLRAATAQPTAPTGAPASDRYRAAARGAFGDLGEDVVENMARIGELESSGNAAARYVTPREDSRGLWQINTLAHPQLATKYDLNDPAQNALAAREVYDRQGYGAWFNSSKRLGLDTTPGAPVRRTAGAGPTPGPAPAPAMPRPEGTRRAAAVFPVEGYTGTVDRHWGTEAGAADLFAPTGTPVRSMVAGQVIGVSGGGPGGNNVTVRGDDGQQYYYAHLDRAPAVRPGQRVEAGTYLGGVGTSGNAASTPPHLHIGIGRNIRSGTGPTGGAGTDFDAVGYLNGALAGPPAGGDVVSQPVNQPLRGDSEGYPGPSTSDAARVSEAAPDGQFQGQTAPMDGEPGSGRLPGGLDEGPYPGSLPTAPTAPTVAPPTRRERVRSAVEGLTDALLGAVQGAPAAVAGVARGAVTPFGTLEQVGLAEPVRAGLGAVGQAGLAHLQAPQQALFQTMRGRPGEALAAYADPALSGQAPRPGMPAYDPVKFEQVLAEYGVPAGEARRIVGRFGDLSIDPTNLIGGGGLLRSFVAEPVGAYVGGEVLGGLAERLAPVLGVDPRTARTVAEVIGTLGGAGAAGARYGARYGALEERSARRVGLLPAEPPAARGAAEEAGELRLGGAGEEAVGGPARGAVVARAEAPGRTVPHSPPAQRVVDAYEGLTPGRVEQIHDYTRTLATTEFPVERYPWSTDGYWDAVFAAGEALGARSKMIVSQLAPEVLHEFLRTGRLTSKFDALDEAGVLEAIRRSVPVSGKREGRAFSLEDARRFAGTRVTGEAGGDVAVLGGTNYAPYRDRHAVSRIYGSVTDGQTLPNERRPTGSVILVFDPATTDRVTPLHHHYGLVNRGESIHMETPENLRAAMWETPPGAQEVGAAGRIDIGDGQRIIDTPWAVGPAGEDAIRFSNLVQTMGPAERAHIARHGGEMAPEDVAALLMRGQPRQDQPVKALVNVQRKKAGLPPLEEEDLTYTYSAARNANRTETMILEPNLGDVVAIYVPGTRAGISEAVRTKGSVALAGPKRTASAQAKLVQTKIRELTGREVPIVEHVLEPGGSKLPPSALSPGRAEVVERYTRAGFPDIGVNAPDVAGAVARNLRVPPAANVAGAVAGGVTGYESTPEGATPLETALHTGAGALAGAAGVNVARGALRGGARGALRGLELDTGIGRETGIAGRYLPRMTEQAPIPVPPPGRPAPGLYDKASVLRMASMLTGPATHLFNTVGNAVMGVAELGMKPAQVGLDAAVSALTGTPRERYAAEILPQLAGYGAGWTAGWGAVPGILLRGADDDLLRRLDTGRFGSDSKVANFAAELPLRMLGAADAVWRGGAFGGHAAALATRKATREGLTGAARSRRTQEILADFSSHPDLVEEANRLAGRSVLQESRPEVEALLRLRRGPGRLLFDLNLPFVRTPYNAAAQGAGLTPAGYLSAIDAAASAVAARSGRTKLARGEPLSAFERRAVDAKVSLRGEAIDRAVRATAGTLVIGLGLRLATEGALTGAYPEDETERSTLPPGWKPYSLRVPTADGGAAYVPVAALGPLAVPLGVAANAAEAAKRGQDDGRIDRALVRAAGATGTYMLDLSALQGINALSQLAQDPGRYGERYLESLAGSLVPASGLARSVQTALGDAARDPRGPLEAFVSAIPGLGGVAPARLTPLGDVASRGPEGPLGLLVGSRVGVEADEPTLRLLREHRVSVPTGQDTALGLPVTEQESREIQRLAGQQMRESIGRLEQNPAFARRPFAARAAALESLRDAALERARQTVLRRLPREELQRRQGLRREAEETRRPVRKAG